MRNQDNKAIFITGSSSGLGRATAKLFASKGWRVIASMRDPKKEKELGNIFGVTLDSGNQPPKTCSGEPRCEGCQQTHGSTSRLHYCGSTITWRELSGSDFHSALHPRRMFDKLM
jgi:hypothetical protein